jgi:hypothetical protein
MSIYKYLPPMVPALGGSPLKAENIFKIYWILTQPNPDSVPKCVLESEDKYNVQSSLPCQTWFSCEFGDLTLGSFCFSVLLLWPSPMPSVELPHSKSEHPE